jgi:DNA invertase Pin-like site-specific DNA recombinase
MAREQLKIAIYARVSTKNGEDSELQLVELREYIRNRKWKIAGEYVDKGISGASDSRPELNRLMADANRRRFDVVAVWKFDRFARSVSHLLSLIGERVRAGLRNAKARGTRLGRPPLKDLSVTETQRLRRERQRSRISFKELAERYGVSVWTAFQVCKRANA